ncbi:MAG: class I SAM-dependent methyltransferase [Pseudomonadota bacterium]
MKVAGIEKNSSLMRLFLRFDAQKLAWAVRRYCRFVGEDALVLEVGSGGNPFPRSNVLVDAYEETRERHFEKFVHDRPALICFAEKLPFKSKSFDFVIAAHVLEHTSDPVGFISELQRIAKAGYIEVPDAFFERINPYLDHRLEITERNDQLIIKKKISWRPDHELVDLYEHRVKPNLVKYLMPNKPFCFHVRHFWTDRIEYKILNPEVDCSWTAPEGGTKKVVRMSISMIARKFILDLLRRITSQTSRNRKLNISSILQCPNCNSSAFLRTGDFLNCTVCNYKLKAFLTSDNFVPIK